MDNFKKLANRLQSRAYDHGMTDAEDRWSERKYAAVAKDSDDAKSAVIAAYDSLLAELDSIEDAASVGRSTFGTLPDSAEDRCIYYVNRLIEIAAKCRAATNKARGI